MSSPPDRADVATTAVVQIITTALRDWLHGEPVSLAAAHTRVRDLLRDEFAAIAHEVRGERESPTD